MNKKVKAVKETGKVILASRNSEETLNQKFQAKKHMTETSSNMGEFLHEAQAELESLFT